MLTGLTVVIIFQYYTNTESLFCTPETHIVLYVDYASRRETETGKGTERDP